MENIIALFVNLFAIGLLIYGSHHFYCMMAELFKEIRDYDRWNRWKEDNPQKYNELKQHFTILKPSGKKKPDKSPCDDYGGHK